MLPIPPFNGNQKQPVILNMISPTELSGGDPLKEEVIFLNKWVGFKKPPLLVLFNLFSQSFVQLSLVICSFFGGMK